MEISGTATVGQALFCPTGSWLYSPTSYAYQWKRNGVSIAGATSASYTTVAADGGCTLTCAVLATNLVSTAQAVSAGVAVAA